MRGGTYIKVSLNILSTHHIHNIITVLSYNLSVYGSNETLKRRLIDEEYPFRWYVYDKQ